MHTYMYICICMYTYIEVDLYRNGHTDGLRIKLHSSLEPRVRTGSAGWTRHALDMVILGSEKSRFIVLH